MPTQTQIQLEELNKNVLNVLGQMSTLQNDVSELKGHIYNDEKTGNKGLAQRQNEFEERLTKVETNQTIIFSKKTFIGAVIAVFISLSGLGLAILTYMDKV